MSEIKQSDLKSCPFDGHFPKQIWVSQDEEDEKEIRYYVKCFYCGAEGPHSTTEKGAANSWNRRVK